MLFVSVVASAAFFLICSAEDAVVDPESDAAETTTETGEFLSDENEEAVTAQTDGTYDVSTSGESSAGTNIPASEATEVISTDWDPEQRSDDGDETKDLTTGKNQESVTEENSLTGTDDKELEQETTTFPTDEAEVEGKPGGKETITLTPNYTEQGEIVTEAAEETTTVFSTRDNVPYDATTKVTMSEEEVTTKVIMSEEEVITALVKRTAESDETTETRSSEGDIATVSTTRSAEPDKTTEASISEGEVTTISTTIPAEPDKTTETVHFVEGTTVSPTSHDEPSTIVTQATTFESKTTREIENKDDETNGFTEELTTTTVKPDCACDNTNNGITENPSTNGNPFDFFPNIWGGQRPGNSWWPPTLPSNGWGSNRPGNGWWPTLPGNGWWPNQPGNGWGANPPGNIWRPNEPNDWWKLPKIDWPLFPTIAPKQSNGWDWGNWGTLRPTKSRMKRFLFRKQ